MVDADRPQLIGAAGVSLAQLPCDLERLIEIVTIDDVEAEQLLLGLGEGAVQNQGRIAVLARVVAAEVGNRRATGPSRP